MAVKPQPWIQAVVHPDGQLELSGNTGPLFRCGPVGTAMWIALCQRDWRIEEAAALLAKAWQLDVPNMMADLEIWVAELGDAGLLSYDE